MSPRHVTEQMCPSGCGVTMTLEDRASETGYAIHERFPFHSPCGMCAVEDEDDDLRGFLLSVSVDGSDSRRTPLDVWARPRRWATLATRAAHNAAHSLQSAFGLRWCRGCRALTSNRFRPIQFSRDVRGGFGPSPIELLGKRWGRTRRGR